MKMAHAIKKYFTEQADVNQEIIAQFPSRFPIKDKTHTARSVRVKFLSFTSTVEPHYNGRRL
jgi:hypothetical protein